MFETEEDVPADLMTSPILEPSDPSSGVEAHSKASRFGATRRDSEDDDNVDDPLSGKSSDGDEKSGDVSDFTARVQNSMFMKHLQYA